MQPQLRIGQYTFDLAPKQAHEVSEVALGPSGEAVFTMDDWSEGMQTVEQGLRAPGKEPRSYISSKGADAAFPGQIIQQPEAISVSVASGSAAFAAGPTKQVDFLTNTYLGAGRYVYNLQGGAWTQVLDLGVGNTAKDMVVHGGIIGVAYGAGFQRSTNGTSWTDDTNDADRLGVLGQNVWRADLPNALYSASALDGSWSSSYTVGDSSFNVTSLTGLEQVLMIGKEDGIYSIDSEGVVTPFTPELRTQYNASFAAEKAVATFNGDYYFRTLNGVVMISGADGQKHRVGLDQLASPDLPTVVVKALTWDDRFLYAMCANSSNDLMILRRSIFGKWHVFYWDGSSGTKQGQHISVSQALGYPALFFSYFDNASTYTTKYIRLPTFPNPLQDTSYRYDTTTTSRIRLPRFGSAETPCVIDRIVIQSRSLSAGVTVTPYYSVDGGAVAQFGSSAATSSPLTSISAGTPPSGHLWDFYFDLTTNLNTSTPVITGVSIKGRWRPQRRRQHTYVITGDVFEEVRQGGRLRRSPVDVMNDLRAARETSTYLSVTDENQQTWSAVVDNVMEGSGDTQQDQKEPGKYFRVTLAESVTAVAAQTFTYGQAVYS